MKISRLWLVLAATIGMLALPATAHADVTISQAFAADSGDSCRYGLTKGTLTWRLVSPPTHAVAVSVAGRLADRPLPADPGAICPDDRRFSIANFAVYAGTVVVDRQARRVDNGVVSFQFILGSSSTVARIDRLVVQVCRQAANGSTVPPAYCGRAVEYRPIVTTP
ncbi:hypothetical protein Rhe02_72140 [Rhizocola hellebori]|uniref:Uncharacterized protein n=1 Tax=Rhizocola hellebori TaxID=1392758 RepID=A0A8J3VK44_9ACTN|nr:hypothetical protein [Rhizocola hellebori]GIH09147.1 hypothetical protein Rhe02_72140 [Rhizocola hellebori]